MNTNQPKPDNASKPMPAFQTETIEAHRIFQGKQEIQISHNGERYRLRITRSNKLILTK